MHSARYRIVQYLRSHVSGVAVQAGAAFAFNPALPMGVKDKGRTVLFLIDRGEQLVSQEGQKEIRRAKVVLGAAVNQGADIDAEVDELHMAARFSMRGEAFRSGLSAAARGSGNGGAPIFREVEVEPPMRDVPVDGAVLLSAIDIEYRENFAA